MSTGAEVFNPYVADIDTTINNGKYTKLDTTVLTSVRRYGADFAIDYVTETRDIYVYQNGVIDDSTNNITATVKMANDVLKTAYIPGVGYKYDNHEPYLILATYDVNDRMINVSSVKPTVARTKGTSDNLTWVDVSTFVPKTADYSYAKAYLWKSATDEITPFCDTLCSTQTQ